MNLVVRVFGRELVSLSTGSETPDDEQRWDLRSTTGAQIERAGRFGFTGEGSRWEEPEERQ